MRRFLFENGLTLAVTTLFLGSLGGQSVAGYLVFNEEAAQHGEPTISYARYLVSSDFGAAVLENWQSEYLQFFVFILLTIWLVQKGSNESKRLSQVGLESDEEQRVGRHADANSPRWARTKGLAFHLYANSLLLVMGLVFCLSWFGQSVTARTEFNELQQAHDDPSVSWFGYVQTADFWERSLQNWQSEFLAIGTMAAFTIYLRQRGSPESKPVDPPHREAA